MKKNELKKMAAVAAFAARKALEFELELTPKPGLVDLDNNGSHPDMDIELFYLSAAALQPYFADYWLIGLQHEKEDIFPALRRLGLEGEKAMFAATNGKNTHKGVHFCLGILLAAAAYLKLNRSEAKVGSELERLDRASSYLSFVPKISGNLEEIDLSKINPEDISSSMTFGERIYLEYGIAGIRAEVSSGFPSITRYGLNSLEIHAFKLKDRLADRLGGILAEDKKIALDYLLTLITRVEDTNLIKRGGLAGLEFAQKRAISYLRKEADKEDWQNALQAMNKEFVQKNLSPGGSADLLALTHLALSLVRL